METTISTEPAFSHGHDADTDTETEMGAGATLDARVRAVDEDRWLASRMAPAAGRRALVALYAVHHEIARAAEVVSEPMLAEIRWQWWREAASELGAGGPVRRHDAAEALHKVLDAAPLDRERVMAALTALIDARARDAQARPFPTLADARAYARATAGGVAALAAGLLVGEVSADVDAALRDAGEAWGLMGMARAMPANAARGRLIAPADAAPGLSAARVNGDRALARAAAAPMVEAADEARRRAKPVLAGADAALWPAYGYVALTPGYARALHKDATASRPLLLRQCKIFTAALSGSI